MHRSSNRIFRTALSVLGTTLAVMLIGQALSALGQEATSASSVVTTKSFWEMFKAGGVTLFVLVALSIYTVTLLIERFTYYRNADCNTEELIGRIKQSPTLSEMYQTAEDAPGIAGRVLRATIQAARDG